MSDVLADLSRAVEATADPAAKVRALNALSTELARTGQAKLAFEHAREARDLAAASGNRQLDAESRHALARCHFYLAEFMPALEHLLAAAQTYQDCGDLAGAATAFAGIGLCQHRLGAQEDAVASLLRALQSARDQKFVTLEINIHNSLGSALIAARRAEEAEQHLAQGIELALQQDNRNLLTKLLLNQSLLEKRRGDDLAPNDADAAHQAYEQALALVARALALARELDNPYDEAHCLGQTGTMLRLLGRLPEAEAALSSTLALGRALDEAHVQAEALLEMGWLLKLRGRIPEAKQALTDAIRIARRLAAKTVFADACESLSRVHEAAGEHAEALALYKEFHAVRETEFASSRKHAAQAAQLWLDFQQATRQASQYRQRAESLAADRAALAKEAKELAEASQQDPLTGLLNRRGLDARIGSLVADSEANNVPLTVALLDIDRFKRINDTHSHAVGDAVLRRVAATIRAHCRTHDLPVRYGGDEFLLVLAGADRETGLKVLQRLKNASDQCPWHEDAEALDVTLSIGLATRTPGTSLISTIAAADRALYEAKAAGRNCIVG